MFSTYCERSTNDNASRAYYEIAYSYQSRNRYLTWCLAERIFVVVLSVFVCIAESKVRLWCGNNS